MNKDYRIKPEPKKFILFSWIDYNGKHQLSSGREYSKEIEDYIIKHYANFENFKIHIIETK